MKTRCDVCNQLVRVYGETTLHYVGIEAEENKRLREALEKIEGSEFLDSVSAQIIATKALQGGGEK